MDALRQHQTRLRPLLQPFLTDVVSLTGMTQYELKFTGRDEGSLGEGGILQARCGANYDWGVLCGDTLDWKTDGHVICRHLGISEYAISSPAATFLDEHSGPNSINFTMFVDFDCLGNEYRVGDCRMKSLPSCTSYAALNCLTENVLNGSLCKSLSLYVGIYTKVKKLKRDGIKGL